MALEALKRYAESRNLVTNNFNESEFILNISSINQTGLEEKNLRKAELLKNDILKKIEEIESSDKIIDDCIECICLLSKDKTYQDKVNEAEKKAFENNIF